jgi:hypothetical protein
LPDFHETWHERYATQDHQKATIFNLSHSVIKTGLTRKLARWETTEAMNFEQQTTAHPTAHLPSYWGSTLQD